MTLPRSKKPRQDERWTAVRPGIQFAAVPDPLPQAPSTTTPVRSAKEQPSLPMFCWLQERVYHQFGRVRVRTRKSTRGVWRKVPPQHVDIPERWLSKLYRSTCMLPFVAALDDAQAIIPVNEQGSWT